MTREELTSTLVNLSKQVDQDGYSGPASDLMLLKLVELCIHFDIVDETLLVLSPVVSMIHIIDNMSDAGLN